MRDPFVVSVQLLVVVALMMSAATTWLALSAATTPDQGVEQVGFEPGCGQMTTNQLMVVALISKRSRKITDGLLLDYLQKIERDEGFDFRLRNSARAIRLQCGLLVNKGEIAEASGLQLAARGMLLSPANAPGFFKASQLAESSQSSLNSYETRGRFSVVQVLEVLSSLPVATPPSEFDEMRSGLPAVLSDLRKAEKNFRP